MARLSQFIRATCIAASLAWSAVAAPQERDVDLALVLAVDCSFSVDSEEFRLQMQGIGQALQEPEVLKAIRNGPKQRIAIVVFQWSDNENQRVVVPWSIIENENSALKVGRELENMPRRLAEGGTSITNALMFAEELYSNAPPATRHVVDVSTDGRNNIGPPLPPTRNRMVAAGITINALVILNEFPTLDVYAESQIAGGPGNFVMSAKNYDDYGAAMMRKLIKEIVGPGTT
jgi:Mg-chelatase subunit ChlD